MSVVVALFIVALLITITGLFLSPRSPERSPRNDYAITTRGRRIVDAVPVPARTRKITNPDASTMYDVPVKRRASARVGEAYTGAISTQQARAAIGGAQAASASTGRRVGARMSGAASVAYPGSGKNLRDRLLSWQVGVPGLLMIFLLCFYLLNITLPHSLLWTSTLFNPTNPTPTPASSNTPAYTASQHLIRLGQLDPGQYQSMQEYNTWAYSACSAASMTEVINSYGHNYRITDILTVESNIHEITPELGLLEESGVQHTGTQFGFKTVWGHNFSLNQVIATANSGTPVIVSFPPAKYPGGHILVVRGGDSNFVDLADSSRLNWTQISHERFLQLWGGFYAIMTPTEA
jgi:hypothetical protein